MSAEKLQNLADACARKAWTLAMGLCGHAADADDLVQQAFLVAHRKSGSIPAEDPWPWFARIVSLEARNMRRKKKPASDPQSLEQKAQPTNQDPARVVLNRDLLENIKRELSRLGHQEREALVLTRVANLSFREAAMALNLPLATLSARVREAVSSLKRKCDVKEEALCLGLLHLPFADPVGGIEGATARWLSEISAATIAAPSIVIGGVVLKKIMIAALVLVAIGITWTTVDVLKEEEAVLDTAGRTNALNKSKLEQTGARRSQKDGLRDAQDEHAAAVKAETTGRTLGSVQGVVVDAEGPVAGVLVAARLTGPRFSGAVKYADIASGLTDKDGRFDFGIPELKGEGGTRVDFQLVAEHPGKVGTMTRRLWLEEGGELKDLRLVLYQGASLTGRVVSAHDNAPLSGVRVTSITEITMPELNRQNLELPDFKLQSARISTPLATDQKGRFSLSGLTPGRLRLYLSFALGNEHFASASDSHSFQCDLTDGESAEDVVIRLPVERLFFTATDCDDLSIPISAQRSDGQYLNATATRVGEQFVVFGLGTDPVRLTLAPRGKKPKTVAADLEAGQDLDLGEIGFEEQGRLTGTVVFENGEAVSGVVTLTQREVSLHQISTIIGEDGRFVLEPFYPGDWQLTVLQKSRPVWHETFSSSYSVEDRRILVQQGGAIEGKVMLGGRLATVSERGGDGRDEHLVVSLFGGNDRMPPAPQSVLGHGSRLVPDAAGHYRFDNLAAGTYAVVAAFESRVVYQAGVKVVAGRTQSVDLNVGEGGSIRGQINGWKLAGKKTGVVRLVRSAIEVRHQEGIAAKVDKKGVFSMKAVPSGTWFLKLPDEPILASDEMGARKIVVEDGVESVFSLDIAAPGVGGIRGNVALGREVVFRQVLMVKPGQMLPSARAAVASDGSFFMPLKQKGQFYLWFADNIYNPAVLHRETITFDGSQMSLDLDLEAASLSGTLPFRDSPDALVTLKPVLDSSIGRDGAARFAVLKTRGDVDGRFHFPRLCAGSYVLRVMAENKAPIEKTIEIKGNMTLDLEAGGEGGTIVIRVNDLKGFRPEDFGKGVYDELAFVRFYDENEVEVGGLGSRRAIRMVKGGTFSSEGLKPGTYRMEISGKLIETVSKEVVVEAGVNGLFALDFHRSAEVLLRLDNPRIAPGDMSNLKIRVTDSSGQEVVEIKQLLATGIQDPESLARKEVLITPLRAGTYKIELGLAGYSAQSLTVTLKRGQSLARTTRLLSE